LDQYKQVTDLDIQFHGPAAVLTADAKKQLDDLAAGLIGKQGYIVEIEGHYPMAGAAGIQTSSKLDDAVKRYLVLEHQIPVYRLHSVALGNAKPADANADMNAAAPGGKPVRVPRSVHIRLMENSLAAQGAAPPHRDDSLQGAERP
jgi:hypothetical protein